MSFPSFVVLWLASLICLCGGAFGQDPVANVPTISVSDPFSIQRAIQAAHKAGLHRISIPAGTYRVEAEVNSGAHLHFAGFKDFEIDATGVTLIFATRNKGGVQFDNCEGVTFRGATLLRETLPFSQGKIEALAPDGASADIQVSAGYPADFDDPRYYPKIELNLYDRTTRRWLDEVWTKGNVERLGPSAFRLHPGRALNFGGGWKVGASVAWRGSGATDINLSHCAGMKIVDVAIKGGTGFCVLEGGGNGGNFYHYTVTYSAKPPGADEEPLMASNADAFHSDGVRKGPTLDGCSFEGMNDDGIPIHGVYAFVEGADRTDITVMARNPPFCQPGDKLHFIDERGVLAAEATVISVRMLPGYQPATPVPKQFRLFQNVEPRDKYEMLTLVQPVSAKFGWLVANASANGNGFIIRGCTVRNNRARGMLIKASDGLIEDCTVENSSFGGIIISPEPEFWNESDFSQNLVVRNNLIRNCNYWTQEGSTQAGAITVDAYTDKHFVPLPGGHRNIVIEGNTFENDEGPNLVISSVNGVTVRDNVFVHPMEQVNNRGKAVGINPSALIWLTESSGVQLAGNLLENPGSFMHTKIDSTPTVTGTGLQDGVTVVPGKP